MPPEPHRAIVWLRPEQAGLIQRACASAQVDIVGAGGPGRLGPAAATALSTTHVDDLRALMHTADADLLILGDTDDLGRVSDRAGADAAAAAHARGVRILTLEPVPPTAIDLAGGRWRAPVNGLAPMQIPRFAPALRRLQASGQLAELLEDFGHITGASVTLRGPADGGSLLARVFDAFDLVNSLFSEPESVDAVHTPTVTGTPVYAAAGSTLEGLDGAIRALVRTHDGRPILVHAGVTSGLYERHLELDGPNGSLRIAATGVRWTAATGTLAYESSDPGLTGTAPNDEDALAGAISLTRQSPTLPPADVASALVAMQAVVLSVRTGQPESPSTVRRMVGLD